MNLSKIDLLKYSFCTLNSYFLNHLNFTKIISCIAYVQCFLLHMNVNTLVKNNYLLITIMFEFGMDKNVACK